MADQKTKTISWEAWEFKHYPKNTGWYVTLISIAILVMSFFILVENDVFAAVSLGLITLLIIFFAKQLPQRVTIELSARGVHFGNLFYPYKQIKYFWVVNKEHHRTVNFHTSAFVNNVLILQLEDQDPNEVTDFLIAYLPEHPETEETLTQKVMHHVKF